MPYKTNADLPESIRKNLPQGAQTIFRKAYNSAYKFYGSDDEARLNKVAWSAVKNVYEKQEDGTWTKKAASAVSSIFRLEGYSAISRWIPVARVGQEVHTINDDSGEDNVFYPTAEAFEDAVDTWAGGNLTKNHEELIASNQILDAKFDPPLLYLKVTPEAEEILLADDTSGRSIELILLETEGKILTKFAGSGLSVLYPPKNPSCTPDMGCSNNTAITAAEAIENPKPSYDMAVVNNKGVRIKIREVTVYLSKEEQADEKTLKEYLARENYYMEFIGDSIFFYKHDDKLKLGDEIPDDKEIKHTVTVTVSTAADGKVSHGIKFHSSHTSGGDIERMGAEEETPPVTGITTEQVDVLIASAVAKKETELNALHEKAIEEKEEEIKKFKAEQEKKVEEKVKDAETRAALLEQIKQSSKPTEEVLAKLATLPTDSLEVFSQLEQTPGGEQTGISSGTDSTPPEEGEYKGANVGNLAATGKWE